MELYLQFGHGMKSLSIELAKKWGGLTSILSPRDMSPVQMNKWCEEFRKNNIKCLFDPQLYVPKSEQKNLIQYSYWDKSFNTNLGSSDTYEMSIVRKIKEYNDIANTFAFICPSILKPFSDSWCNNYINESNRIITAAKNIIIDKPIWTTLSLPCNFLVQREDEIEDFIQNILRFDVDGYYIIAEVPEKKYLVDNPLWLTNLFHICSALKIANKTVVYGYGNHQLLLLSMAKIDAIASGTWLNVRSFTNRFIDSDEMKRRSTWIYYPPALSEYKLSFIDLAYSTGILQTMELSKEYSNEYGDLIFKTKIMPSATGLTETTAFKFYLCSLKKQIEDLNYESYKKTYYAYEVLINTAQRTIEQLEKKGIFAQTRSFRDIIDVNRAAMQVLDNTRGFALEMSWDNM